MNLADAQAQLAAWEAASLALAAGKSYAIADRQLSRSDTSEVLRMIGHWQRTVDHLTVASTNRKPAAVATWS